MILDEIRQHKERELDQFRVVVSSEEMRDRAVTAPAPYRDFAAALAGEGEIRLIAEIKRASPSKGVIRRDFNARAIAKGYADAGAAVISVLTDERFFQGSLQHLELVRGVVSIPLLRKDFILDPYQLWEARLAGADAVLLIVAMLSDDELSSLLFEADELGLAALVEVHDEDDLDRALANDTRVIGINNRNLDTFEVDTKTTERLRRLIPEQKIIVSESGITKRDDLLRLQELGIHAALVGETLMRSPDPGKKAAELLGRCD